jgi:2-dehydro-3-deoxy-L-rhamnonate dehydrogenase (NAD+)
MGERRVAIVTGGARGIGHASAVRLAHAGREVVVADLESAGGAELAEVEAAGGRVLFVQTDVRSAGAVEALMRETLETFGRVDILVNCAGILGRQASFLDLQDDEWLEVMNINLAGVYRCCKAALPHMLERHWGRIVTITSNARHGRPLYGPYAVSKAGVTALMASLANAYAGEGVLVNCVEPGRALTDMVTPRFSEEHLAHPPVPIGRYSSAQEVATVVNYLCEDENTYTAGAIWQVAGGAGETAAVGMGLPGND